jgi:hypothetical protein
MEPEQAAAAPAEVAQQAAAPAAAPAAAQAEPAAALSVSASSTPRSVDSASAPNLFTLVTAAASGNVPAPDGQLLSSRSHRSRSNSQSNTPRAALQAKQGPIKRGGLTGLPPRKTAAADTPRSAAAAAAARASGDAAAEAAFRGLDMRDDSGDNDFDAELAAQLLGHDDQDSEWETEEGEAPSFAQLYAAAEAASKAGPAGAPVRPTPAGSGSKRAGQEQPVLSLLGVNLLEHFDRSYLIGAGVVLGTCATSALLLAIKARLR